ncbi:capsular polysaccharide synthesis protein [uncultured Bacteroides sp.]|uniref:capsular polysaccharide synthesis protein n=1 Tax=uncultured Bacteroides sp. TaxID=162156 RepID=UPI00261A2A84|nr:capsular polysaccharide synthesis protein [uncultured Bacteroides sp.]
MKEPKLIRKIKKRSNEIVSAWKVAGFTKVYDIAIRPHCGNSKTALKRHLHKNEVIMETLRGKYGNLLSQYKSRTTQEGILPENAPVWVCWWQGESSMPEIVQICYQSLRKHTSHPIHLITKDSIGQYLQLPDFIEEKVQKGRITLTHLSDILRMALLAQYGGLWIDATVYVSQPIQEDIFHTPLFTVAPRITPTANVSQARWTGFLIGGAANGPLFSFARDFLFAYWEQEDYLLNYFLIDYIIALAYETLPSVSYAIDHLPDTNSQINKLEQLLNQPFSESVFHTLTTEMTFHKLNYKQQFAEQTSEGKETFYGHLCKKARL